MGLFGNKTKTDAIDEAAAREKAAEEARLEKNMAERDRILESMRENIETANDYSNVTSGEMQALESSMCNVTDTAACVSTNVKAVGDHVIELAQASEDLLSYASQMSKRADEMKSTAENNMRNTSDVMGNILVDVIAPQVKRDSGYLKIERTGFRRGDNAEMATISFVDEIKEKEAKSEPKAKAEPKAKPAKKETK